jgi:hypothetical protein
MTKRIVLLGLAVGVALTAFLLAFCGQSDNLIISSPYRVSMYTNPKQPHVGEVQIAFRVQTQDYKIVSDGTVTATYQQEHTAPLPVNLRPGPGKDFRAWLSFNQPGRYYFNLIIMDKQAKVTKVRFKLDILPAARK